MLFVINLADGIVLALCVDRQSVLCIVSTLVVHNWVFVLKQSPSYSLTSCSTNEQSINIYFSYLFQNEIKVSWSAPQSSTFEMTTTGTHTLGQAAKDKKNKLTMKVV